jgi:rare lipoprotein A
MMLTSWYGPGFHGRLTASGTIYNQNEATVAHKKLRFGTIVILTNPATGKTTFARVTDRGPYWEDRELDVSWRVAEDLGMIEAGVSLIEVHIVGDTNEARF